VHRVNARRRPAASSPASLLLLLVLAACGRDELYSARRIPIQHNGRVKALAAFAAQEMQQISGRARWQGKDPLAAVFELAGDRSAAAGMPLVKIEYVPLRAELGLDVSRQFFSLNETAAAAERLEELLRSAQVKRDRDERPSKLEQKAELVYNRLAAAQELLSGGALTVVPPQQGAGWSSPYKAPDSSAHAWFGLVEAFAQGRRGDFVQLSAAWREQASMHLEPRARRAIALEAHYGELQPLRLAWILYLAAFALLVLGRRARLLCAAGCTAFAAAFLFHSYGLALRAVILGRPPVSNMYESMIFMNWALALFAACFAVLRKEFAMLGGAACLCALIMIYSSLLPIDPSMDVLVPVLRSNYWLTIHVLTIVASYGALGLAMALGHRHLILQMLGRLAPAAAEASAHLIDRSMQLGVLLLGTGTVLGGVWANESWGRFWGWDPKETWSLITFLGYLTVIHLRHYRRLGPDGLALASIICFLLVLMTWYGVNFLLGRGLHSYGSGSGGLGWIGLYLACEAVFVLAALALFPKRRGEARRRRFTPRPLEAPGLLSALPPPRPARSPRCAAHRPPSRARARA